MNRGPTEAAEPADQNQTDDRPESDRDPRQHRGRAQHRHCDEPPRGWPHEECHEAVERPDRQRRSPNFGFVVHDRVGGQEEQYRSGTNKKHERADGNSFGASW